MLFQDIRQLHDHFDIVLLSFITRRESRQRSALALVLVLVVLENLN